MAFRSASATMNAFADRNEVLSKSPDSNFVKLCTVQRRHPAGTDVMRGLVLRRFDGVTTDETTITDRSQWFGVLESVFGLSLSAAAPERRDELWARVQSTHQAWQDPESVES
jgi:arylamine N-acetyltransferase